MGVRDTLGEVSLGEDKLEMKQAAREFVDRHVLQHAVSHRSHQRGSYFSAPFVQLGLPPDGGLAWLLAQRLGRAKTAEVIFTSSRMSAPDAAQAGLITTVTEPGQALAAAITLATQIATANRHAIELSKRLLAHTSQPGLQTYQALELALAAITQHTTHPSEQHIATPTTPQPLQPQEPATLPTTPDRLEGTCH
jgi:hypothetical protein